MLVGRSFKRLPPGGISRRALAGTFSANLLIQALNVATGVMTARALAATGRGELAVITMWPQFLAYCMALGLPAALVYHVKKSPEEGPSFILGALISAVVVGSLAAGCGVFLLPYLLDTYSPEVVQATQFALLLTPVSLVALILSTTLQAQENFTAFNISRILPPLMILAGLAAVAAAGELSPIRAAWIYLLAPLPLYVLMARAAIRSLPPHTQLKPVKAMRRLYGFGLRYSLADLGATLMGQFDRVVVAVMLQPNDLGIYVVARSASQMMSVISASMTTVLFPRAAAMQPLAAIDMAMRSARHAVATAAALAIPLALLAPWLLAFVYGDEFRAASMVFAVLLAETVISVAISIMLQGFIAAGRPGRASITQSIGIVSSVILLWIFAPLYGLEGCALAMLLSTAIRLVATWAGIIQFKSQLRLRLKHQTAEG